jgi:hypothetical protein
MADFASVLVPRFRYYSRKVQIATGTNDELTFREDDGVDIVATIPAGSYTWQSLAYQIKRLLEAEGASAYTVRYRYSNRTMTLTSDGDGGDGRFELIEGGAQDALPTIGFTSTVTGALVYTSDTPAPGFTTLDFTTDIRAPQVRRSIDREDLTTEVGRAEVVTLGHVDEYVFFVEEETAAVALGWFDLIGDAAEQGEPVRFFPDKDVADYVEVDVMDRTIDMGDMATEGVYRAYRWTMTLREHVPNAGALDLRSLIDRRPS